MDAVTPTPQRHTCIIHVQALSDHGRFTPLSRIIGTAKEKLQQLHNNWDRRLHQAHDSLSLMQSFTFSNICHFKTPAVFETQGFWKSEIHRMTLRITWRISLHKYPVYTEYSSLKHKFNSVSLYDQ